MILVLILIIFSLLYSLQLYYNNFITKIITVTFLFIVSSGIYFSFESYKGWPTTEKNRDGQVIGINIKEPTKNEEGAIFVWILEDKNFTMSLNEYIFRYFELNTPRVFKFPYTESSSKEYSLAEQKIKKGYIVMISGDSEINEQDGSGPPKENVTGQGKNNDGPKEQIVPHLKIISPDQILKK